MSKKDLWKNDTKLTIAIQKSGRLSEKSLQLLAEAGIGLSNGFRKLVSCSPDFPLEALYLRDDDIPQYVSDGVADVGIVGENVVAEKARGVETVEKLGFARCRLSLAVPRSVEYNGPAWFAGKRIATSYPRILQNYLREQNLTAEIHEISGSVEISPGIGLADSIFDIVSSGSTLISNGLKEAEVVMHSEAVLIARPGLEPLKRDILEKLLFRMRAVMHSYKNKYILLNAPNEKIGEISRILPGIKSPTVMPLAEPGWSSLHSVVNENEFWEVIDRLKANGAQGILVIPIEKMIV
ncbi:MAG TPA: ATP phosphoribosyltransferase [Bacteroidetes bacterium]|nr:ATP phosphoribosyltransferase [Bacteroidota bacterium]